MKESIFTLLVIIFSLSTGSVASAQTVSFYTPVNVLDAFEDQTRTIEGLPGINYWQNAADYKINVAFDPETRLVKGDETIVYYNNSPDTLDYLLLHLFPDMYKKGTPRDFEIAPQDEHDGVFIKHMIINNKKVTYSIQNEYIIPMSTYSWIELLEPILPESTNEIIISWEYPVNKGSHNRTGQVDSSSFFIAYWFPRIGVYDDIAGWNEYSYSGVGEFYNDFGDFDVNITVPGGYVVWATGELQNPQYTLSSKYYLRYKEAKQSDEITKIIESGDLKFMDFTAPDPEVTWRFKAKNVTDFAFALSDHYLWDAVRVEVDKQNDKAVFLQTAYNKISPDFPKVIHISKRSIEYMSDNLPGVPFPYPSMTIFNGLDEMEYPMMVNDISLENIIETYSLTSHEIHHTYFPFYTGCNERRYAWMDEGLTSYFEYNIIKDVIDSTLSSIFFMDDYNYIRGTDRDFPLFVTSEVVRDPEYYALSYPKAAIFFSILEKEIGKQKFIRILGDFINTWKGKHPTGHDLLNFIQNQAGKDVSWIIQPWMFEYGYVDLAIDNVEIQDGKANVHITNNGSHPAPYVLDVFYEDGSIEVITGNKIIRKDEQVTDELKIDKKINMLRIYYELPVDVYPTNDVYIVD